MLVHHYVVNPIDTVIKATQKFQMNLVGQH